MGLEIINELKKKKGLTIDELSEQSGVPKGTLNKILSGQTKDPKLETLKAIAKVLGCTLDDFNDQSEESEEMDAFTQEETEMIEQFRSLDQYGKDAVISVLNVEHDRCKNTVVLSMEELERMPIRDRLVAIRDQNGFAFQAARNSKKE